MTEPRTKQCFTDCCAKAKKGRNSGDMRPTVQCSYGAMLVHVTQVNRGTRVGGERKHPHHVRKFFRLDNGDVEQFDIQVLIHRMQRPPNRQVYAERALMGRRSAPSMHAMGATASLRVRKLRRVCKLRRAAANHS